MVTMATMSKVEICHILQLSNGPRSSPVHVGMTVTILLISIGVKQLLDCPILQKNGLIFNVGLKRY